MNTVITQAYMGFTNGTTGPGEPYQTNVPVRLPLTADRAKIMSFRCTRQEGFGATFTIEAAGAVVAVIGGSVPDQITGNLAEILIQGYRVEDVTVTATQRSGLLVTLLGEV
jgi:hypothetical protein